MDIYICSGWNSSWLLDIFQGFSPKIDKNVQQLYQMNLKKKIFFWKIQKSKKILSNTLWLFMILGFYISFLVAWIYWGQWPNGLRCCERIGGFLVQIPLSGWLVLGTQLCYEAPIVLWVGNRQKCIQLTSG